MHKKILFISIAWLCAITGMAQNLEIKQDFKISENSSAAIMYHNQFGQYEKPALDDTFPYAVVRVLLEGNAHEVKEAKKMLGIYTGVVSQGVKASYLDFENEILFLVPSSSGHVELSCGEGCARQTILELPKLQSNAVYVGKVHYTPMEEPVQSTTTQAPKRQFFKFRVTPTNAVVTIMENGAQEILPMREGGIASKMLNYGTYNYSIAADKYHTKEGSFTVSATQTEMTVDLLPQFGWLTITGDNISQGGYVFATNAATGGMIQLGTIPLNNKEMNSGVYTLRVQKEKYKDYSTTITIEEGEITTIRPSLEANFAQVTLTTNEGTDIYVDGSRLGTTRWTGTLELGEHSVEARQASHHSAYTNVRITPQSAGQTITLNNPLPIYGSLIVDGSPADVTIYVDGKKVGTSPLFIGELLIGIHNIRLEKEGYDTQEKTVTIAEGQESTLSYDLVKTVPAETINTRASASSSDSDDDVIFVVVETMPEFPGGQQAMMQFIGENLIYPPEAQKNGIQGRVICQFVVNKDGSIGDIKVIRSSGYMPLDNEAIRLIQSMPRWKPGLQRGKPVRVKYTVPVSFRLQ